MIERRQLARKPERGERLGSRAALVGIAFALLSVGCRTGGGVTNGSTSAPVAVVSAPIISSPAVSPFYSKSDSLLVTGVCQPGATVYMTGAFNDEQICTSSAFSFTVSQTYDGLYTLMITQTSPSQTYSNPSVLVWVRKSSVAKPIITSPSASPFASSKSSLTIAGSCESGATISLSGGARDNTTCQNSAFSLVVPKAIDGDYDIQVTQTDGAGNAASSSLVWQKHALVLSPVNPRLVVKQPQVFTASGGSGIYTVTLTVNNSGATFDAASGTYTAGTLGNVVDTLVVEDSLGSQSSINITTVSGTPDHLVLPDNGSGAEQTGTVGAPLAEPIKVQVVDQWGNGIPAIPLVFRVIAGAAELSSQPFVLTDAQGFAQATVRLGYTSVGNRIAIEPVGGALPDLAGTGHGRLVVDETAQSFGTGRLGSTFNVGANPGALVAGDFNGDGKTDIAILNVSDSSLGILLGKGNGLFDTMIKYRPICAGVNSIAAGDINGDGKVDLAIACTSSGKIAIMLGNGDGAFEHAIASPFTTGSTQTLPLAVALADFNHDGKLDLAVTSAGGAVVGIWRGDGTGGFALPPNSEYIIGQTATDVLALDLDKDGYPDLVVANSGSNNISTLINKRDGTFDDLATTIYNTGGNPTGLAAGDFNKDGYPDIAVVENGSSQVSVFLNDKTGSLQLQSSNGTGTAPSWITVADFDKDGNLDIAAVTSENSITVLNGFGNGNFSAAPAVPTVINPICIAASDFNQDGYVDLAVTGNTDQVVQLISGRPGGAFGLNATVGVNPTASVSADFDGDGKKDLAVVNSGANSVSVLKGLGNGLFSAGATLATGSNPSAILAADLNGDGKIDLILTARGIGKVQVFLGNGDGTFQAGTSYGVGNSPAALALQDLNNDSHLDLVVANSSSSTVSVLIGHGDGTFDTKVDYHTSSSPLAVVIADFNGDRLLDVAVVNQTSNNIGILLGNGDGTLQAEQVYATGLGPFALVAADVNRDGIADLVSANAVDGSVSVLIGTGTGSFYPKNDFAAGAILTGLLVGDFSGDGKLDLVVSNGANQSFTLLPGNGSGQFNTQMIVLTNANTGGLSTGDLNGDGALDLITFENSNNAVQIWLGH